MIHRAFHDFQGLPTIRIQAMEKLIRLTVAGGKAEGESLFTLHSVSGFRQPGGALEIEKVAGYCHERRKLRTIWLHRIRSVVDAATGEQIHDLAAWLERAPEAAPAAMSAAAATDEATLHAWRQGETEIAERLFRIGAQLKRQDPSNRPC